MLTKERMVYIMNTLHKKSFVTVKELTEELQVSRSSVVRDLIEMESRGLIQRERGGASLLNVSSTLTPFNEPAVRTKGNVHEEEKRKICKEASSIIKDGDCIFIDAGTTATYLMDTIYDKKITIVTANTYLLTKIPDGFPGKVYLIGGEYSKMRSSTLGPLTIQMLGQFHFDYSFLTANGISIDRNEIYVYDFEVGAIKKEVLSRSTKAELLIDSSKFAIRALCTWASLDDFHTIYVDDYPQDKEMLENIVICR